MNTTTTILNRRRPLLTTAMLFIAVITLASGVHSDDTTVCMIPFSNDNPRSQEVVKQARGHAATQKATLTVIDGSFRSLDDQYNAFNRLSSQKCDAIIIEPHPGSAVAPAFAQSINETVAKGTPVIAIMASIDGANFSNTVMMDPSGIADQLATGTCSRAKSGDTVYHVFPRYADSNVENLEHQMLKEFKLQMEQLCPKINVVGIESKYPRDVVPNVWEQLKQGAKPSVIVTDHPLVTTLILNELMKRHNNTTNGIKLFGLGANAQLSQAMQDGVIEGLIIGNHQYFTDQAMLAAVLGKQGINIGETLYVPILEMNNTNLDQHKNFWAQ